MSRQTKFIAVCNRRGGVGKTTITMMLTYALAVTGRQKVLVIDLDAQSSTSMVLMGWDRLSEARAQSDPYGARGLTVASLMMEMFGEGDVNAAPYISRRVGDVRLANGAPPELDIIPGSYDLDDRETEIMISQGGRHITLNTLFDSVRKRVGEIIRSVDGVYDYVIIDCAPGISHVVWGALRVVDFVLIPYIPDQTAEENVGWLVNRLTKLRRDDRFRVIPNRVTAANQGIVDAMSHRFQTLGVQVPMSTPLSNALDFQSQPSNLSRKFGSAAPHVRTLFDAVVNWVTVSAGAVV